MHIFVSDMNQVNLYSCFTPCLLLIISSYLEPHLTHDSSLNFDLLLNYIIIVGSKFRLDLSHMHEWNDIHATTILQNPV